MEIDLSDETNHNFEVKKLQQSELKKLKKKYINAVMKKNYNYFLDLINEEGKKGVNINFIQCNRICPLEEIYVEDYERDKPLSQKESNSYTFKTIKISYKFNSRIFNRPQKIDIFCTNNPIFFQDYIWGNLSNRDYYTKCFPQFAKFIGNRNIYKKRPEYDYKTKRLILYSIRTDEEVKRDREKDQ